MFLTESKKRIKNYDLIKSHKFNLNDYTQANNKDTCVLC